MRLKKSKLLNILCSLVLGTVAGAIVLIVIMLTTDSTVADSSRLVFRTDSDEKVYDGLPLTDTGWSMVSGTLKTGHRVVPDIKGSRTDVGTCDNAATMKIYDDNDEDVTAQYKIEYEFGRLTVTPRPLTVTSASAFKLYDGLPLTAPTYEIKEGLLAGHTAFMDITGSITEVGMAFNSIENFKILDADGIHVTSNYSVRLKEGVLMVNETLPIDPELPDDPPELPDDPPELPDDPPELPPGTDPELPEIPEQPTDPNRVIYSVYSEVSGYLYLKTTSYGNYNGQGWEPAPEYAELIENTYSAAYLTAAALTMAEQQAYTVRIKSFCDSYGLPYYFIGGCETQTSDIAFSGNTDGTYTVQCLAPSSNPSALGTPFEDYERAYRAFVYENYLALDDESRRYMLDLIAKERFSADDPTVIQDVAKYIQGAADYAGDYPPEMETEENVAIAFLETYQEGVCRHYAAAAVLLYRALGIPARYTVGALADAKAGTWVDVQAKSAHAWVEVYIDGTGWVYVEVTGSADDEYLLTLKPENVKYEYDGNYHGASSVLLGFEKYAALGYTYSAVVSGSRREIGKTETVIEDVRIFNPLGRDVTDRFKIKKETGVLQIYRQKLCFESKDEVFIYGTVNDTPSVIWTNSEGNEALTVIYTRVNQNGGLLSVGRHLNDFSVRILNEKSEDVTDEYLIEIKRGALLIEPRKITFKAGDASKVYDGTPLTCNEIELVVDETDDSLDALYEGHTVAAYEVSGSQKLVGRSENTITYIAIHDKNGNNVTHNYTIVLLPGTLKVTLR